MGLIRVVYSPYFLVLAGYIISRLFYLSLYHL